MKKVSNISLWIALPILLVLWSCSSEKVSTLPAVPEVVQQNFNDDYPKAKKVEWVTSDNQFSVEFKNQRKEMEILYDELGAELKVEEEISLDQVPQAAKDYISVNYPDAEIEEQEKVRFPEEIRYEVEIEYAGDELELYFSENGQFLELEEEEEEEDEDENEEDDD